MTPCRVLTTAIACLGLMAAALPAGAGAISGTAVYEGLAPKMRPIQVDADPKCAKIHEGKEPPKYEWLLLGEGQTVANVLVEVIEGVPEKDYPVPDEPLVLTQKGCVYSPHVFVVRPGQTIKILNPDDTLHNIHFLPKVNSEYNKSMPESMKEMEYTLDKPEPVFPIKCEVHTWMKAYCAVLDHPFYDITDIDGKYTIEDLPPGGYTVQFWHEKLDPQTHQITVSDEGDVTFDVTFTRPKPRR